MTKRIDQWLDSLVNRVTGCTGMYVYGGIWMDRMIADVGGGLRRGGRKMILTSIRENEHTV